MMTLSKKYRAVIHILRQERDVIATLNNPMDAEQLADYDRQIAGAQLGLQQVLAGRQ